MNGRRGRAAAVATAAALLALDGCSGTGGAHGGQNADCAWELHYGGALYQPGPDHELAEVSPHHGSPLGHGYFDGCQDGGGPESRQTVDVYRIAGIDPALAVMTEDDTIGVTDPDHVPPRLALPAK